MTVTGRLAWMTTVTLFVAVAAAAAEPPAAYTETITTANGDKITFEMLPIPAGTFKMGSPDSEPGRKDDEGPVHEVKLDAFFLCKHETTLQLFMAYYQETSTGKKEFLVAEEEQKKAEQEKAGVDAFTGPTPVYGDLTMGYENNHPAIGMTWLNAANFCKWLSIKTGKPYRLPTEAEWEYAARAGNSTAYYFGDDATQIKDYALYGEISNMENEAIGKRKPNAWGLYDMLGNVREWVHDFYSPTAYADAATSAPAVNPTGPETGQVHVARGGDYNTPPEETRCASRSFEEPWWRSGDPQIPKSRWWLPEMDFIGFRVACSLPKVDTK